MIISNIATIMLRKEKWVCHIARDETYVINPYSIVHYNIWRGISVRYVEAGITFPGCHPIRLLFSRLIKDRPVVAACDGKIGEFTDVNGTTTWSGWR